MIVLRHPEAGAARFVADLTAARVVNAGDGKHQHPTQALLDLHTMREAFGHLDGLHVAIVGDVAHSRVARSLVQALALVGANAILVGPPALSADRPSPSRHTTSLRSPTPTSSTSCGCSASACCRARTSSRACASTRRAGASRPSGLRPGQKVMHPGPMNRGVEIDARVADSEASLVVDQVRSGLVVRMAVLYDLLTSGPVAVEAAVEVA